MLKIFSIIASWITYDILGLRSGTKLADAVHFFIEDTGKIFFLTALLIFMISFLRKDLSYDKLNKYLNTKSKWIGYLFAVILGWVTPFCSCSSIPLFISFITAGIPLGITMTFLAVSPMPIEAIAILGTTIGLKISILYMIVCGFAGVVFGMITDKFGWEKYVKDYGQNAKTKTCSCSNNKKQEGKSSITLKSRYKNACLEVKSILEEIWGWVLLGIIIGAVLHGYVPENFFLKYIASNSILSIPFAVILGVPLYSNAAGTIPIMESLFLKGVPVGTVLTFMMSITALSLPQLIILKKVIKTELILRFVAFLTISFILIGILFNLL